MLRCAFCAPDHLYESNIRKHPRTSPLCPRSRASPTGVVSMDELSLAGSEYYDKLTDMLNDLDPSHAQQPYYDMVRMVEPLTGKREHMPPGNGHASERQAYLDEDALVSAAASGLLPSPRASSKTGYLGVCFHSGAHHHKPYAAHVQRSRLEGRVQVARVGYCDLFICYVISCVVVLRSSTPPLTLSSSPAGRR